MNKAVLALGLGALAVGAFAFLKPSSDSADQGALEVVKEKVVIPDSDWPQYGGGPQAQAYIDQDFVLPRKLLWKQKIGTSVSAGASIVKDQVYIGSGDHKIYALNRHSGEVVWSFEAEDVFEATPLVLDDKVYIGNADYRFYCLDANSGRKVWSFESDGKMLGSANYTDVNGERVIITGSYDGFLYSFKAATGNVNWKYDTENYVNGAALIDNQKAYFGGCDEQLHGVNLLTGKGEFTYGLDAPVPGSANKRGDLIYVGTHGGRYLCYNIKDNKIQWEIEEADDGFYATSALGPNSMILAGRDKLLRHLKLDTGELIWEKPLRSAVDSSPLMFKNHTVVGTKGGKVLVYHLDTGEKVWEYDVGSPIIGSLSYANGVVFASVQSGTLYAFGVGDA